MVYTHPGTPRKSPGAANTNQQLTFSRYVGMIMLLSMTTYVHTTVVLGPSSAPTASTICAVLKHGKVQGAMLPPILIERLCEQPSGIETFRGLVYLQYVGASLNSQTGSLIAPLTRLVPSIGSTESGGYFVELQSQEDWEYVSFQPHAGAKFECWHDQLHQLVFQKDPSCMMQSVFLVHPDTDRYETHDLWIEHPTRKGLWRMVGRTDDYIYLATGDGLHASTLESEIEKHELVKTALIGGHGRQKPVLLIELQRSDILDSEEAKRRLLDSLESCLSTVNKECHPSVQLSTKQVLFATQAKPFMRTVKGTVARILTLRLYEQEISSM